MKNKPGEDDDSDDDRDNGYGAAASDRKSARDRVLVCLATGLGLGFAPFAPGTVGAVLGVPLAWAIGMAPGWPAQILIILSICLASIPVCTAAAKVLGEKDPGAIVLDEIASLPITFFLVPISGWTLVVGFGLHRLFDITKPPPARQLERLPGGLGIMADDWAAGVYSCGVLHVLMWVGWLGGVSG